MNDGSPSEPGFGPPYGPGSEEVYRKVGRRYQSLGWSWLGWPAPGVWLVEEAASRRMSRLGDAPDPMTRAQLERRHEAAVKALREAHEEWQTRALSYSEIVDRMLDAMAREDVS